MKKNQIAKKIRKEKPQRSKKAVPEDEEIDSDFLEDQPQEERSISAFDEDENRIQLAKSLIQQAKSELKKKQENDDFFANYNPIDMDDEEKKLNIALQEKLLHKNMQFTKVAHGIEPEKVKQVIYKGHLEMITCGSIDPLCKLMYSGSKDCSIIKWDIESGKKEFLQREFGKHGTGHYDEVLTMSLNFDGKMLATAGKDHTVKLWDCHNNKLIETLKSHKSPIYGVKFGLNSNNLASICCDRTLKLWDAGARAYIDTFFGHITEGNDIDSLGSEDFLTCGYDRQVIIWKTKYGSQLIYNGHNYSIDCIRALSPEYYMTGSMDSSVGFWNVNKKKPLMTIEQAHGNRWVTALGSSINTDLAISGSYDNHLNCYKFDPQKREITQIFKLPSNGIVSSIQICQNLVQSIEGQEHRLGRWITQPKAKNQIKLYILS